MSRLVKSRAGDSTKTSQRRACRTFQARGQHRKFQWWRLFAGGCHRGVQTLRVAGVASIRRIVFKLVQGTPSAAATKTAFKEKAAFIARVLKYNLPADYVARQQKILNDFTQKEILHFTRTYLNPNKMNIVVVGDKDKILSGLQKQKLEIIELDADGNVMVTQ